MAEGDILFTSGYDRTGGVIYTDVEITETRGGELEVRVTRTVKQSEFFLIPGRDIRVLYEALGRFLSGESEAE